MFKAALAAGVAYAEGRKAVEFEATDSAAAKALYVYRLLVHDKAASRRCRKSRWQRRRSAIGSRLGMRINCPRGIRCWNSTPRPHDRDLDEEIGFGLLGRHRVRVVGQPQRQRKSPQPPAGHSQVSIWPGAIPDPQAVKGPEKATTVTDRPVAGKTWTNVEPVTQPTMTVFAPLVTNTGVAVVVFPGGGYQTLAIDLEGTEVCEWLISKGITCVLSKYFACRAME